MRSAILKLILALGRYAVLPAVAVALAVLAAWLIALDHYPRLALAISPVVLPFTTGAVFLAFGLPLLIVLDERAVRAVVAHEVGHAELQHTSGGANLNEFILAALNIFEYADSATTITGRISETLLNALLEWLQKEYLILSRRNELED